MSTGRGQPGGHEKHRGGGRGSYDYRGRGRGGRGGTEGYTAHGGSERGRGGYAGRGSGTRDPDVHDADSGGTVRGGYSERGAARGRGVDIGIYAGRGAIRGAYSADGEGGERGGYAGRGAPRGLYGDNTGRGVARGGYAGQGATRNGYNTENNGGERGGYVGRRPTRGAYDAGANHQGGGGGGYAGPRATRGVYGTGGRGGDSAGHGTGPVERGHYRGRGGGYRRGHANSDHDRADPDSDAVGGRDIYVGEGGSSSGAFGGIREGAGGGERGRSTTRGDRRRPTIDPRLFNPPGAPPAIVDAAANSRADEIIAQLADDGGWDEAQLPPRPSFGTAGVETAVRANFFKVGYLPESVIHEYDVIINSKLSGIELRKGEKKSRLFELLVEATEFTRLVGAPASAHIAHDSNKILLTTRRLNFPDRRTYDFDIRYYTADETPSNDERLYKVQISWKRSMRLQELQDYVEGKAMNYDPALIIRALDTILVNLPPIQTPPHHIHTFNIGPKRYIRDKSPSAELGRGLLAYRGYYSSVRTSLGAVLCNINVCMAAFFKPMNLGQLVNQLRGSSAREGSAGSGFSYLKGLKVATTYTGRRRVIKIEDIGTKSAAQEMFMWDEEGREVSVAYYFERRYKRLRYPNWLCGKSIIGGIPASIPLECCEIVEDQIVKHSLPGDLTTAMLTMACRSPKANADLIVNEGMQILGYQVNNPSSLLRNFNITVSEHMEVTSSRILPVPSVKYKARSAQIAHNSAGWNLQGVKFSQGGNLTNWAVMILQDPGGSYLSNPNTFVAQIVRMWQTSGINIIDPHPRVTEVCHLPPRVSQSDLREQAAQAITRTLDSICTSISHKPRFLLVFLSNDDSSVYKHLKFLVDCKFGIPTVCCQSEKIQRAKGRAQYLGNIAMKVNVKIGGKNHELTADALDLLGTDSLILGADVTHPASSTQPQSPLPSIAGVVGSYENSYSLYPGSLRLQKSKQEMIEHLREQVVERLDYYRANNPSKRLPGKIWYFRDGVSEGQFEQVNQCELPQIRGACAQASGNDPNYKPKIVIIICVKRHHTRFYPTEMQNADGKGNCAPGTVVDRGVTSIRNHDFYLQAHVALQGTARAAHYTVVYDEMHLTADGLHKLVHNMSYLFARATKAVSYVPPAYYADILCDRGYCYLQALILPWIQRQSRSSTTQNQEVYEIGIERRDTRRQRTNISGGETLMAEAKRLWGQGPNPSLAGLMFYL